VKDIVSVVLSPYMPSEYGLMQSRRRLTRVYFKDARRVKEPDKTYRVLLEEVYRRMAGDPLAPIAMPGRIKAEWRDDERAFVLHGLGLRGFRVDVAIVNHTETNSDVTVMASESELAALHGSPLPSLG
jgi:hypothetical protein